ncbi:MAG: hypothetical protein HRT76_09575 [Halieaceae bacterium]|nr:hypothetical protein [Halieaceae bacterium]
MPDFCSAIIALMREHIAAELQPFLTKHKGIPSRQYLRNPDAKLRHGLLIKIKGIRWQICQTHADNGVGQCRGSDTVSQRRLLPRRIPAQPRVIGNGCSHSRLKV